MPRSPSRPPTSLSTALIALAAVVVALLAPATARPAPSPRVVPVARDRQPNPIALRPLFVEPHGPAKVAAAQWQSTRPADAALIAKIGDRPQALWLGDWVRDVRGAASARVREGMTSGSTPVLVAYDIPLRDCGQQSSGGARDAGAYRAWIDRLARGIGAAPAIVVLEPDALAGLGCLPRSARLERVWLIREAVLVLARLPRTAVYIDGGNPGWIAPRRIAARLRAAGIDYARGFAVNVSGFAATAQSTAYGEAVSRLTRGARFVIDTSRNGNGAAPSGQWCNPPARALGEPPGTATLSRLADAYLWVKRPGESDGSCNAGPPAGVFWPEYALDLARRAPAG